MISQGISQNYRFLETFFTVLNNRTLHKQGKIVLPASLVNKSLSLAHSGAHPGQNGLVRRLRTHFYIKGLNIVEEFANKCKLCQLITQKTIKHPTELNRVPGRYWDEKSIDLFCPIPSKNHIVIIQDLATCYPVAKVARSTNAKSVIPVLEDI